MIVTNRRQHRLLAEMQRVLRRSDPRLVAKFAIFTRLTRDEDIPPFERVRGYLGRWTVMIIRHRRSARGHRRSGGRNARWHLSGLVLIPATVAAMFTLLLVSTGGHAPPRCVPARSAQQTTVPHEVMSARGNWLTMRGCTLGPGQASGKGR